MKPRPSSRRRPARPTAGSPSARRKASASRAPRRTGSRPAAKAATRRAPAASGLRFATKRGTVSISWRAIMVLVTLAFSLAIVLSPLQHFLQQREQARELNAQVTAVKENIATYERDKARWSNEDYIAAQARDRLGWVLPGETPYVVIDPYVVTGEEPERGARGQEAVAQNPPWYVQVRDSIEIASGKKDVDGTDN